MSREYRFDRYRKGRKMAEGLVLTKPTTVEQAMETVYLLAGPSDTFVLREDLARLATVEAERDAARAKRDAALAEVAHMKREQQAMIMQHRHDIRDLGELLQDERCKVATIEAAWYAAQAGEARAVEALEAEQRAAHWRNLARITDKHEDHLEAGRLSGIAQQLRHSVVLTDSLPPLAWLAQQRREAAVEELKKLGPLGSSNQELFMVPWGEIKQRIQELEAAALRAGEAI